MTFDQTALHQLEKLEKKALESRSITGRSRGTVTVQLELETCTVDNVTSLIVTAEGSSYHTHKLRWKSVSYVRAHGRKQPGDVFEAHCDP